VPHKYDPGKTHLVNAHWAKGVGCPPDGTTARIDDGSTPAYDPKPVNYFDDACKSGDRKDKLVDGLVLVKTGPTANNAAAVANLKGVKGTVLQELGYDIRKAPATTDVQGSHCGAGAPRFDVVIDKVLYFIGCNSPSPASTDVGTGWLRLTWGPCGTAPLEAYNSTTGLVEDLCTVGGDVDSISIVFDEGQDVSGSPDQFGVVILDNVNVNGQRIGTGE
jgi:hypothetical protein